MKILDIHHSKKITDWEKIKEKLILKCSQGTNFSDSKFKERRDEARKRGLYLGSYHFAGKGFLDANNKLYFIAQDPIKEADWYLKNVGDIKNNEILALDWEIPHTSPPDWCNKFIDRIKEKIGKYPFIYLNESTVLRHDWSEVSKKCSLWIAKYNTNNGQIGTPPKTGDWKEYAIWQYTSRGKIDGIEGNVDLNIAKLTPEAPQKSQDTSETACDCKALQGVISALTSDLEISRETIETLTIELEKCQRGIENLSAKDLVLLLLKKL